MHTTLVEYTLASTSVLCIILSFRNVIGSIHFLPVPHVTLRIYRRLVDSFIRVKPIANMYPWGKTPFPAEKIPAILLGAGVAAGLLLYAAGGFVLAGSPAADTETGALDMRKLRGVLFATLLMAMLLEGGLGTQVMVKSKGFKAKSDEMNAANRGFYNSLEHAIPAIIFIWTHAVLVNGNTAAVLGITYAAARFTYGFLYGMFGGFTIAVEPCTEFCYTLLSLLLIGTLGGLAGRGDLLASAAAQAYTAVPLGIGAIFFWWAVVWSAVGVPVSKTIIAGVAWKEEGEAKK